MEDKEFQKDLLSGNNMINESITCAPAWKRCVNLLLDSWLIKLTLATVAILINILSNYLNISLDNNLFKFFLLPIFFIGAYVFLYSIFEINFQKTPAKFLTKTKVVNKDGGNPAKKQILIRSLFRLVPFEPLSGFLFGDSTKYLWWHDTWSQTMVIGDVKNKNDGHNK